MSVTNKDINKHVIIQVKDKFTGKTVWRNFGYKVFQVYENGNVMLVSDDLPKVIYRETDVRVVINK